MVRNAMSATEFYILQYLWTRETPATFAEIMVHFNEVEKKAWKKQTVNTFLSRLSQKGFLNVRFIFPLSPQKSFMKTTQKKSLTTPTKDPLKISYAHSQKAIN